MNINKAPTIAIIDTADGDRYYFLAPVLPSVCNPAIAISQGEIRPCFDVIPERLGAGSIYAEGSLKVCTRHRELVGIRAALGMMEQVWSGVLRTHPGAIDDMVRQKHLARSLTGPADASFSLIEKSGSLGKAGVPKKAEYFLRNVMALAHWKLIWQLRKIGKGTLPGGKRVPGGVQWKMGAALINAICYKTFSDWPKSQMKEFTARSLEDLAERHGLPWKVQI